MFDKKKYDEQYKKDNHEKILKAHRKYNEEHREDRKEYDKQYSRLYRENHSKIIKGYNKQWYRDNLEKCREYYRQYRKENPEKIKEYRNQWRKNNPIKVIQQTIKKYNLSYKTWSEMLENQNGKCRICGKVFSVLTQSCIDHDHKTGKVRGLLCFKCNFGLGNFKDDPELMARAIKYLEENKK